MSTMAEQGHSTMRYCKEQLLETLFLNKLTNHHRGGVRHVIFPMWVDLYDFAQLVEHLKIGTWGCRAKSPSWTTECIQEAILLVLKKSHESSLMASNAASFGELAKKTVGRDVAAQEVARMAASGHS